MEKALKDAITICKTLLRNGYDAHVINAPVQEHLLKHSKQLAVDIACEPDLETLLKLFPEARVEPDQRAIAQMEKDGVLFRFYALEVEDASHPELSLLRITPTMANMMDPQERLQLRMTGFGSPAAANIRSIPSISRSISASSSVEKSGWFTEWFPSSKPAPASCRSSAAVISGRSSASGRFSSNRLM